METAMLHFLYYLFIAVCWCSGNILQAIELPNYTVILSQSDFQIRLYNESTWVSARVSGTSFDQSYRNGFQRFYLLLCILKSPFLDVYFFLQNMCKSICFHRIFTLLFPFQINFHSNTLLNKL